MSGTAKTARRRNGATVAVCLGIVAGMAGLSYAAVPLYQWFCQVTGFAGTTQRADAVSDTIGTRQFTVRFDANVNRELPWSFKPVERKVELITGEHRLAYYEATNASDRPVTGTATFNVTPLWVGAYFSKVECFCFTEQTLQPNESISMPVSFFIDPDIEKDPNLDSIDTITLSYTFFPVKEKETVAASGGEATNNTVN
ncbi:MAG: cytochrome c oxidase assembly protein [Pseudomonadota bacterium]